MYNCIAVKPNETMKVGIIISIGEGQWRAAARLGEFGRVAARSGKFGRDFGRILGFNWVWASFAASYFKTASFRQVRVSLFYLQK